MPQADLTTRIKVLATIGVMLALLLAALDQTIVGTALPRIVAELNGLDRYSWLITGYLVASTVVVPIAGKLGDLFGRKPFLIAGMIGFVAASALCGVAQDMTQLIIFRVLQGLHLKTEAFTRDGLRARFPQFDVDLGRLDVEAGFLHVPPITAALVTRLQAADVAIEENTAINRIGRRRGLIAVDTAAGERVAEHLVLTAGLGTNDLLARIDGCDLRLPLRADRPNESKYLIPPPAKRAMFTPDRLPVFAYLDVGIYGHPMLEGKTPGVKIGYYNPPDVRTQVTSITSVQSFVAECMPELLDARVVDVEGADQCSYDLVADDNFILGAIPDLPGAAIGTGWRGTGYKFAPLIGRTLMELALERRTVEDISRFTPERFVVSRAG